MAKYSRALKAGLKRFPEKIVGTRKTLFGDQPEDANVGARIFFMIGYQDAEKDIAEELKKILSITTDGYLEANIKKFIEELENKDGDR